MTMKQEASKDAGADRRLSSTMMENSETSGQRSQVRSKRQSIAIDAILPNIEESEEASKEDSIFEEGSVFETSEQLNPNEPSNKALFFQTEVPMDTESDSSARSSKSGHLVHTRSTRQVRRCEASSGRDVIGRLKADSREAHADDTEFSRTPDTGSTNTNTPRSQQRYRSSSSKSSLASFTKLELGIPSGEETKAEENSRSDSNSQRSPQIPDNFKMPYGKCMHRAMMSGTNMDEDISKSVNWKGNYRCMLCDVTDEADRSQEESNKLMLDIVYPHEFYDRYSRARNSKKATQGNTKDAISICKPARVSRKAVPAEKSLSRLPIASTRVQEESGAVQYGGTIPEKRRKHEAGGVEGEAGRKEIHEQCKPRMDALVVTEDPRDQGLVLKGLKGWLLKKHDECNKLHKDTKQSLYRVSTLGMQFGLPDYNMSLHDRKPTSPRPVTCMSARDQDNVTVIRNNIHTLGPRQRTMPALPRDIPTIPRDIFSSQSRGLDSQQRELIHIPHRLPTAQESKAKAIQPIPSNPSITRVTSSQRKSLEQAIAKVMKAGLSLPPISSDVKTSVKLGNGPT